ncbi:IS66 family transposase zinc-finger binding domain-containing protein, partial [Escherichia coli]|nr:IS66 family transposase zinc-finger binding domain-containing protein [Escherichia coli]
MLFGQSSEKSRNKLENKIRQAEKRLAELENRLAAAKRCLQDDEPTVSTVEQAEPPVAVAPQDRPARRSRRQKLPADLPRETRRITPTVTVCPKCGGDLKVMSETVSEQLEIIRSAFKVIETVRPKLACSGVLVGSALNTQSQTLTNSGLLQGEASLTVNTQRLDNQQNGTLYSAADLTLDIPDIRNSGLITGDNGLTLNTASLSNPGKIIADTLNVRATTLDGDGLLQGAGALALAGDTLSQGRNGRWLTAGDLSLRGKTLHTAGTMQGQNLTVQADNWANSGSVLATGNLTASATGQLTSTGDIMSQGDTTLNAATTDNRGSLLSAGTLSLDGNSLDNSGTVQGNHVTIRQNSVTNSGTFTGIAALTLAARMASPQPALMNNGGS